MPTYPLSLPSSIYVSSSLSHHILSLLISFSSLISLPPNLIAFPLSLLSLRPLSPLRSLSSLSTLVSLPSSFSIPSSLSHHILSLLISFSSLIFLPPNLIPFPLSLLSLRPLSPLRSLSSLSTLVSLPSHPISLFSLQTDLSPPISHSISLLALSFFHWISLPSPSRSLSHLSPPSHPISFSCVSSLSPNLSPSLLSLLPDLSLPTPLPLLSPLYLPPKLPLPFPLSPTQSFSSPLSPI